MRLDLLAGIDRMLLLLAGGALALFPASVLPLPSAANGCFAFLLAWGLWSLARGGRQALQSWLRLLFDYWPLMLAMAALPLALAWHQAVSLHRLPDIPYLYLRFALFALLTWGLLALGTPRIRLLQWGFVVGAIEAAVWIHFAAAEVRPSHVGLANVIPFANLSLMMGMLSLLALGWTAPRGWLDAGLKLAAGLAGLYASYLSGTRGSWVAIPVLVMIVVAASRRLKLHAKVGLFCASIGAMALVGFVNDRVQQRIVSALGGLTDAAPAITDTSVSARLELWRASIDIFVSHPLAGVGPNGFPAALRELAERGFVSPATAALTHSHNDLLFAMATLGVPGLLAMLATYLVPAWFFLRHLRSADRDIRVASAWGLATCIGFMAFGLTEAMFVIALNNAFYTVVMAACCALVVTRKRALAGGTAP